MRVDHEKREIVCAVGDLVHESTYRRIGVERGDGFRRRITTRMCWGKWWRSYDASDAERR